MKKQPFNAFLFIMAILSFSMFSQACAQRVTDGFDWQGHRGCRGLLPENSIPAFLKALEFPAVRTLELDLAVSADKQLIVSHEPWFNDVICTNPDGRPVDTAEAEQLLLYRMTAAEIRRYDCGSRGNPRFPEQEKLAVHKPTLTEVIAAVREKHPDKTVRWNLEIKSNPAWDKVRTPPVDEFAALVVAGVRELRLDDLVTIQSFDPRALQAVRSIAPKLTLALLVENQNGLEDNLQNLGFQPDVYSPYFKLLDKRTVRKCHKMGMQVIPWTVNEPADMKALIKMGVDGMITDYPDRIF